jgi:hypothetical protein
MPPLNSRESRQLVREANKIPGAKSLHRGIHFHQNAEATAQYKKNPTAKRSDPKDLLVHHQKINAELQDMYARTAALHKDNMTMEQRIEESWKALERCGGKRPKKVVGFAEHLSSLSSVKKDERARGTTERLTSGETTDYGSHGSALHNAKDRRIKTFVKRQLKRAHLLRRMGDPTPLKQSGKFDAASGTLKVFNKTIRSVKRQTMNDAKVRQVKNGPGRKSMWDLRGGDENINLPATKMIRYSTEFDLQNPRAGKRRRTEK